MSKFYGTLQSDKGTTTRAGHRYITATAQTWNGSVAVNVEPVGDDFHVIISVGSGSTAHPLDTLVAGKLSAMLTRARQGKVVIIDEFLV